MNPGRQRNPTAVALTERKKGQRTTNSVVHCPFGAGTEFVAYLMTMFDSLTTFTQRS